MVKLYESTAFLRCEMNWEKIVELIPSVISEVKKDYVLDNEIIKDGIFGILEKHCTVVYYPLDYERNCGFHTTRYINDKTEDFVYINTAKSVADQVFTAAHELGHVWKVAERVWEQAGEQEKLEVEDEEKIVNRFAAELLMPTEKFRTTFKAYIKELKLNLNKLRVIDLVQIMVMQMNDYMVPYESVRRRMVETDIISNETGKLLLNNGIIVQRLVEAFSSDQNTMLDRATDKKTIPGMRNLLKVAEAEQKLSVYTIKKIKKDFDIDDIGSADEISATDRMVDISVEGDNNGEN